MISALISFLILWIVCTAEDYYYFPHNVTRSTVSGLAAYRSALTLDWLEAEDSRQRELAAAFETEPTPPARVITSDCIAYPRPAAGKIARLMLELLRNLEGDDGTLISDLIQTLIKTKILVETSMLEAEPDLDALVKTPDVMIREPHITFPRILAMSWMTVTDPATTRKYGWCPVNRINKFLLSAKPYDIAKQMRALEPIVSRARYIMEEFIQNVTPLNMYQKRTSTNVKPKNYDGKNLKPGRRPTRHETTLDDIFYQQSIVKSSMMPMLESEQFEPFNVLDGNEWPSTSEDLDSIEHEFLNEERWTFRLPKSPEDNGLPCVKIKPSGRDIVKRFYAILPFFDKEHSNTAFLHKFRGTIYGMSEGEDLLDREAAFYAAVLTPIVFLQQYRDMWCLLERFHRAIRLYQISHPTEKRSSLKLLQNLRAVNYKIRTFIMDLSGSNAVTRPTSSTEFADEEIHDKKDIRYLKELIKNLG